MNAQLVEILGSIDELAKRGRISRNRAFAAWYAITFYDLEEDDALEAAAADGGNDQGIDIVFADINSEEIVVLQAHCPSNYEKKTPKEKWDAVISSIAFIENPDELRRGGRLDLAEAVELVRKDYPDFGIAAGLISLGAKSDAIDRSVQAQKRGKLGEQANLFYVSQTDILERYKSLVEAESGIPEDTLTFCESYFEDSGDYGRAWIGTVSAVELSRLYNAHPDKLFAGNVRLFLGNRKGGINEQIIKTAKDAPGNFWALNNGITIVADQAIPLKTDSSSKDSSLTLKRFSIVNGCQTTSCLVRAGASSSARVLARVIAAKSGLKNEIVRYNNSQNAVKIWAVRGADDIQEHLRRSFKAVDIVYAPKQEGSRKKRNPSTIELDRVTQFLASAEHQYLIQAIDNKGELFDEPYQKLFGKSVTATEVYLAWLVGNLSEELRRERVGSIGQGDHNVALLGVRSGYWVVYCTYKLMRKFSDLDSPHKKLEKMKTQEFSGALKQYVNQAIDVFYDAAIDTYNREELGSVRSCLRSSKFLQRIDSKVNNRISRIPPKALPDLASVFKSIKLQPA